MTPVDDLQPGDHIAIVGNKADLVSAPEGYVVSRMAFPGVPLKILAISLPFLAVQTPDGSRCGVDVRFYDLKKLDRKYIRALMPLPAGGICTLTAG